MVEDRRSCGYQYGFEEPGRGAVLGVKVWLYMGWSRPTYRLLSLQRYKTVYSKS